LEEPTIPIGIAKGGKRTVALVLGLGSSDAPFGSTVVETANRMKHSSNVRTSTIKFGTGCLDVIHDEMQALH
jgi:hypothetical protein